MGQPESSDSAVSTSVCFSVIFSMMMSARVRLGPARDGVSAGPGGADRGESGADRGGGELGSVQGQGENRGSHGGDTGQG